MKVESFHMAVLTRQIASRLIRRQGSDVAVFSGTTLALRSSSLLTFIFPSPWWCPWCCHWRWRYRWHWRWRRRRLWRWRCRCRWRYRWRYRWRHRWCCRWRCRWRWRSRDHQWWRCWWAHMELSTTWHFTTGKVEAEIAVSSLTGMKQLWRRSSEDPTSSSSSWR